MVIVFSYNNFNVFISVTLKLYCGNEFIISICYKDVDPFKDFFI